MLVFEERGNQSTRRKAQYRVENRQSQPTLHRIWELSVQRGPHWWEASALTTALSLHPNFQVSVNIYLWNIPKEMSNC